MKKNIGSIISIFLILLIIAVPVFYFLSKNRSETKIINLEIGEQYYFNQESVIKSEDSINIEDNKVIFNEQGKYTIIEIEKNGRLITYIFDIKDSSKKNHNNEQENNSKNNNSNNNTNNNSNNNKTTNNSNNNQETTKNNDKQEVITNNNSNNNQEATTNNKPSNDNSIIAVKGINLNLSSISLKVGETKTLIATISPTNATNQDITWTSSNTKIATVSNGKITPKRTGTVTITATVNNIKANCTVTITGTHIHFISHLEASGTDHITGDAILLESDGAFAMIDAGNTDTKVASHITDYLKKLGVTKLDFLMFTHMHSDHAGNLQALLKSGIKISNIWIKNYDVAKYQVNYIPNYNSEGIDIGLKNQTTENNDYVNLNNTLSRFKRILYISNYSQYKNLVTNIKYISDAKEGKTYTFKNLKFTMTLYNNKLNVNTINNENYDSVISLIEFNSHRILLTGDAYDTKQLNTIATKIGKVDILKLPHHGSRGCALLEKKYLENKVDKAGTIVTSTALNSLNPTYFVITSSKKKIENIRKENNVAAEKMCVDKISSSGDNNKYYVDETSNALVVDLTNNKISFYRK